MNMHTKTLLSGLAVASFAITANAVTLVSSALDNSQTDITGSGGIFSGTLGGDASVAVGGVTTTIVSNLADLDDAPGTQTITLRAVSAVNGMDLTYNVSFTPFRYDESADVDVDGTSRVVGFAAVESFNNDDRESTSTLLQGDNTTDVEFFRVTIDTVVNSGATAYNLDGAVALRFNGLSGISVSDTYVGGVTGNVLGSGGSGTSVSGDSDISLSSPSTSFAIVATADDATGPRANFENRWEGIAVQFNDVPEPGSLALLGLGGVLIAARRRRKS